MAERASEEDRVGPGTGLACRGPNDGDLTMLARTLIAAALALGLAGAAWAQDADHPKDKTLVVGSDFGVAPWMVRGASGPEGCGGDMIKEVAKRIGRPGVEVVD